MNSALTYDDIQLLPCKETCEIQSRKDVNTSTRLSRNIILKVPFVASPMDTICEWQMAQAMGDLGGIGFIHRFISTEAQCKQLLDVSEEYRAGTIGAKDDAFENAWKLADVGAKVILIDVAHGNHINVIRLIEKLKASGFIPDIIAGNVATMSGTKNLIEAGADGIRVGIGGGSMCVTRMQTGVGVPMASSVKDCWQYARTHNVPIMADGGIRFAGDVCKAIACGADTVMIGKVIAGTKETPGKIMNTPEGAFKVYRGSASYEAKIARGEEDHVEGVNTLVPIRGKVSEVLRGFEDGLRSSMAYLNCKEIYEMQYNSEFIVVTAAGQREALPHGKR
jgi:IMP dehydrogenase